MTLLTVSMIYRRHVLVCGGPILCLIILIIPVISGFSVNKEVQEKTETQNVPCAQNEVLDTQNEVLDAQNEVLDAQEDKPNTYEFNKFINLISDSKTLPSGKLICLFVQI